MPGAPQTGITEEIYALLTVYQALRIAIADTIGRHIPGNLPDETVPRVTPPDRPYSPEGCFFSYRSDQRRYSLSGTLKQLHGNTLQSPRLRYISQHHQQSLCQPGHITDRRNNAA